MSYQAQGRWLAVSRGITRHWNRFAAKPRGIVGPGRAVAANTLATAHDLVLSEWLVLAGLALAVLWSRLSKFVHLDSITLTSHIPGLLLLSGIVLTLFGKFLFRSYHGRAANKRGLTPRQLLWPILGLAVFILVGSIYAIVVDKEANTFRIAGFYMLGAYFVAAVVAASNNPAKLVFSYYAILAVAAVLTLLVQVGVFASGMGAFAPFHELEFFIIPLVIYVVTRRSESSFWQLTMFWGMLAASVLFKKNTAYLIALGVLLYTWLFHWRINIDWGNSLRRLFSLLLGVVIVAAALGIYYFLRQADEGYVPSGNTEFRLFKYELAWRQFLDSPVWGTAFAKAATQKFTLYDTGVAGNVLPTHSDLLDLLANGGTIGGLLWVLAHLMLFWAAWRYILRRAAAASPQVKALAHTLACMILLGVLTYAVNPLWLNPPRAMLIWAQFGLLAGLAIAQSKSENMPA